jgi:uncharacterized damage-inducible protein DinB
MNVYEPTEGAWHKWAQSPETVAFLSWLRMRDQELCAAAKQAVKQRKPIDEFILRASVFDEIAENITSKNNGPNSTIK